MGRFFRHRPRFFVPLGVKAWLLQHELQVRARALIVELGKRLSSGRRKALEPLGVDLIRVDLQQVARPAG